MSFAPQPPDPAEQAFGAAIEEVLPRLHVWARLRLRVRPEIDPEDFVQEVCTRAWSVREKRDGDGPFGAWIFQIAKFVLLEALRSTRRSRGARFGLGGSTRLHAIDQLPDALSTMSRRVARRIDAEAFVAKLRDLDPVDEQVLVHCGLEEKLPSEVAAQIGLSVEAVTKRWQRLRERLKWAHPSGE